MSSANPKFYQKLDALFPGLSADPGFAALLPTASLVYHRTGPSVFAFSVQWRFNTGGVSCDYPLFFMGTVGTARRVPSLPSVAPSSIDSAKDSLNALSNCLTSKAVCFSSGPSIVPGDAETVPVGGVFLVTPYFVWSPAYYAANSAVNWSTVMGCSDDADLLASYQSQASSIAITLDAAVFSDYKLAGRDEWALGRQFKFMRNGAHDVSLEISKMIDTGATDDVVVAQLFQNSQSPANNASDYARLTSLARRRHADALLNVYNTGGRQMLASYAHSGSRRGLTTISRVKI